jgi:aryl carrier-like protein
MSSVEYTLRDAWQRILGVEDFSGDDNFFDLGGDSFAAAKLAEMMRDAGAQVRVFDIVRAPTFSDLVAIIQQGSSHGEQTPGGIASAPPGVPQ